MHGCPTAKRVETSTCRPYEDGNQIASLRAHPIYKLTRKKAGNSVENGEERGDCTVIIIGPMEFGFDKLLKREGEYLTVKIIDSSSHKQQAAKPPTPV